MLRQAVFLAASLYAAPSFSEDIDANIVFANKSILPDLNINKNVMLNGLIKGSSAQFTISAPIQAIDIDGAYEAVGRGYDPITNTLLGNTCVKLVGKPDKQVYPKTTQTNDINTTQDLNSLVRLSASAVSFSAVVKGVSLGFASSSAHAVQFNSVDKYGRMYVRIVTDYTAWPKIAWKDDSFEKLARTSPKNFMDMCGTRYVQAIFAGTLFDQVVRYELKSDGESSSSSSALGVGVKEIFGATASFSSAAAKANSNGYFHSTTFGVGSLASPPAPTAGQDALSALFNYYYGGVAASVIKDKGESGVPLYIVVKKYYTDDNKLPYADKIPTWNDAIMDAVTSKSDDVETLMGAISEIDSAISNGDPNRLTVFYNENKAAAVQKRKDAETMIKSFDSAINSCQKLAKGPENLDGGKSAVDECKKQLDDAIPADKLASVQLSRKP